MLPVETNFISPVSLVQNFRGSQVSWLPCEIEALSIATATKHFSPYIIQSNNNACILTDSKPCVQAFEKLCRGEFSTSPRVSTFLSVISRFQASVRHVSGAAILPSDFASRNTPPCQYVTCQVCAFIHRTQESVVRQTSIQDILHGHARLSFTTRASWLAIQSECKDLRRTHAHLVQGTRPSKKLTNHNQRLINHPHSMKSKAPLALPCPTPDIEVGDLIYIHSDSNKSRARDRYLVTNVEGSFCNVRKFIGSQLRSTSYRIKKSGCYHVPGDLSAIHSPHRPDDSSGDEEDPNPQTTPPAPPAIPCAISLPADQHVPEPEDNEFSLGPSTSEPVDLPSDNTAERQFLPSESINQPRRSARPRWRPARYDNYVTD
ncbi:hypothetical protein P5673_031291 [Acropora cervicornis]|uniref:Uncharacterized protein n=1 Tax=Acropora cervicornis TaxID=6130 RepID=A0AAD9USQ2_ACRCE|nr:hypothetical protein P5673_031291 [Acropora cervicornis]